MCYAQVLLEADGGRPNWTDAEIAEAFEYGTRTVEFIRERLVTEGFEITLNGKPKSRVREKILDGEQEAKIIAVRLGEPPKGFENWTLRLFAEQAVSLEIVESVSHETLRRTLKKTHDAPEDRVLGHPAGSGCRVRREHGGGARRLRPPYDSRYPLLCMDEQPIQLLKETRTPIAGTKNACTSGRLRIRASGNSEHLHVCANPCVVGDRCRCATDEPRLTGRRKWRSYCGLDNTHRPRR